MKRILVLMMAVLMCLGCLAACSGNTTEPAGSLDEAVEYLNGMYKADNGKETPNDYDMPAKVIIGDVTYTVTWSTDNAAIVVKESAKAGFYTIDLPAKNDTAVTYKLIGSRISTSTFSGRDI